MSYAIMLRKTPQSPWGILNIFETEHFRTPGSRTEDADERAHDAAVAAMGRWRDNYFKNEEMEVVKGHFDGCKEVRNPGK